MQNRTRRRELSDSAPADRRVLKTKRALHEALVGLVREREYEDISVQHILDRANVGRSTFYMHYRDKDDLLVSGIHDMIGPVSAAATAPSELTWFSLPILEHHERHRRSVEHRLTGSARAVLHEHLRHVLTRLVGDRIRRIPPPRAKRQARQVPPELVAAYISATFVLVLNWWLDTRAPFGARDVHELFRSLVAPATSGV